MMKKLDKDEALAKISALIKNHFEQVGREMIEDLDIERKQLIEDIDEILGHTEVSVKHLILEQLKLDDDEEKCQNRHI